MGAQGGHADHRQKRAETILAAARKCRRTRTAWSWHAEALKGIWKSPQDVKDRFGCVSICGNNGAVSNAGGNKSGLVVEMQNRGGIVWVRFTATHEQYDRSSVESVNDDQAHSTDEELRAGFHRLGSIFQAEEGKPAADERDVLVILIETYENQHVAFGPADPVAASKFRMEQQGLTARDLEAYIGPSGQSLKNSTASGH